MERLVDNISTGLFAVKKIIIYWMKIISKVIYSVQFKNVRER